MIAAPGECTLSGPMPSPTFLRAALVAVLAFILTVPLLAQRQDTDLTNGWKFIRQDVGLQAPVDGSWAAVTVPHTWNTLDIQQPLDKSQRHGDYSSGYYRGPGWYERTIAAPATWRGKRVFLRFEAASLVAQVYLNGREIGEHQGGFTAFCLEITPDLRLGADNDLRVRVDNAKQPDLAPLTGDFNIGGGLYRPVHLLVTDALCISPLDFASPGVYLTPRAISAASDDVAVRVMLSGTAAAPAQATIATAIHDANGKIVAHHSDPVPAADSYQTVLTIHQPHRWNGRKDPYLYTVTVRLMAAGKELDTVTQPLGLRTIAITEGEGFLLNGVPYPIHGVNRHQEWKDSGWALTPAENEADAKLVLDLGATAIRLTHYPQSEEFHTICDRNGLLLWNEISLVNEVTNSAAFAATSEQQLREMILQRYNHPSAVFWGLFNELNKGDNPWRLELLRHLKQVVQEIDPSRLIVAATNQNNQAFNQVPDWICWNLYPGWYGDYSSGMTANIAQGYHEVGHRIGVSEYGAGANVNQHEETLTGHVTPYGPFHPEEYQTWVHEQDWAQIRDNPQVWGSFIWCLTDFTSERRHEGGTIGINDKGLVTYDRKIRKDAYFFYQANWSDVPMVHIAGRRATGRTLAATQVEVFSNCPTVTLSVNGTPLEAIQPDAEHVFRWPVTLRPGANKIDASAMGRHGSVLHDAITWTLEPSPPASGGT
jgi:beta-galactosidase